MKVLAVNEMNNYRYKVSVQKFEPTFKASFWNRSTDLTLQEKFDCGLKALEDEKTILVVTNKKQIVDYTLKEHSKDISIPIEKMFTLEYPKIDDEDFLSFVVYKKGNQFHLLNINSIFNLNISDATDKRYTGAERYVKKGETRILKDGDWITKKTFDDKNPIIFKTPKFYDEAIAQKNLEYRSLYDNSDKIKKHNAAIVAKFLQPVKKANSTQKDFTFADIGGLDDVINELKKYVLRPIKFPAVFEPVRLNKGILLSGPPRCGKTLLGKALANEAGVKYRYMNANEFTKSTHGSSEELARNVFDEIMKEPTILFIDEIDAIGKSRGLGGGNAHYDDKFLTQLLGCMSDLEKSNTNSFIIAATNRKDLLDRALVEPGRFGLHLDIVEPDEKGIEAIYNIHTKNHKFEEDIDKTKIFAYMFSKKFNGSDIAETITNAYFNALERLGMTAKMDAGIFTYEDLKLIKICKEDIWNSMEKLAKQKIKI